MNKMVEEMMIYLVQATDLNDSRQSLFDKNKEDKE